MGAVSLTRVSPATTFIHQHYSLASGKKSYLFFPRSGGDASEIRCNTDGYGLPFKIYIRDWIVINQGRKSWPVYVISVSFAGNSWEVKKTSEESDNYLRHEALADLAPITKLDPSTLRSRADLLVTFLYAQLQDPGKGPKSRRSRAFRFLDTPKSLYEEDERSDDEHTSPGGSMGQNSSPHSRPFSLSSSPTRDFDFNSTIYSSFNSSGTSKNSPQSMHERTSTGCSAPSNDFCVGRQQQQEINGFPSPGERGHLRPNGEDDADDHDDGGGGTFPLLFTRRNNIATTSCSIRKNKRSFDVEETEHISKKCSAFYPSSTYVVPRRGSPVMMTMSAEDEIVPPGSYARSPVIHHSGHRTHSL